MTTSVLDRGRSAGAAFTWPDGIRASFLIEAWLIVIATDRISFPVEAVSPIAIASLFAAGVALLRRNPGLAALAFALDAANLALLMPDIANHLTLLLLVDLVLIATLTARWGRRSPSTRSPVALRYMLVLLYLTAAVHKLNDSYTDLAVSCARLITDRTMTWFSLPPSGDLLAAVNLWIGVGIEFAIPLLLIIRRTRPFGLLIGLGFHGLLALTPIGGVASFSMFVLGSYVMFFDETTIERLARWRTLVPEQLGSTPAALVAAALTTGLVTAVNLAAPGGSRLVVRVLVFVLFGVVLAVFLSTRPWRRNEPLDWAPTAGAVAIGLYILVAAALPYLGGRTQIAFSMFSNLRTEVAPNHDFLPTVDAFGYQEDLVTIPESPHRRLDDISGPDLVVPAYEVGRRLQELDGAVTELTVEIDGRRQTLTEADLLDRFPAPSFAESKLIRMRATERSGPVACRH